MSRKYDKEKFCKIQIVGDSAIDVRKIETGEEWEGYFNPKVLHGQECEDEFVEYIDEEYLKNKLVTGYMHFEFDDLSGLLYTVTEYIADKTITVKEIQELINYTRGQWSDGIGEGYEQYPYYSDGNIGIEVYISPWHQEQKIFVRIKE